MKQISLLLFFIYFSAQASGFAQKVTLSVRNATIEEYCSAVQKQTGYFFLYDKDVVQKAGTISAQLKNADLNEVLTVLASKNNLSYRIVDKTIIISRAAPRNQAAVQDEIRITGVVSTTNEVSGNQETVPGVVVTVKETRKATSTDVNGRYSISAPANGTLVFSMVGFTKKEMPVNGKNKIDAQITESVSELKEVIITGYGTSERKENQVGSAFQVTSKDLERRPLERIDALLEGVVPGLQYETQDQTAGSARPRYQTRIRGEGSIGASNEPLWVVDGIPLNTGNETNQILGVSTSISPLTYMNPNDIESVTVLKDATATSIYGANGANGVILITTKKGRPGDNRINYSFRTGINVLNNNKFQVLNYNEYRELLDESFANSGLPVNPVTVDPNPTDWYDLYFRNGITTQHDLSFSGGNDKTRYYVSTAYFNQKPIEINNQTQRLSTRINLDQKVNKSIDIFFRLGASYNLNDMFSPGNTYYTNLPVNSPYNQDGTYKMVFYNQLPDAEFNEDGQKTFATTGSVGGTIRFIPSLSFTTNNGIDFSSIHEDIYESINTFSARNNAYAYKNQSNNLGWTSQNRLNFQEKFGEHTISALLGGEAVSTNRRSVGSTGWGFANDKIREVSYAINTRGSSSATEKNSLSYFGQFNYSYKGRYHAIGSFRRDGNSDFGTDVKWASFSSVGAAWTISNEAFWNIKQVDFAKLKISYGTNGNSRIGSLRGKGVYSFDTGNSYNGQSGAIMTGGENPVLSWETTYLLNAGLSVGLFNRISLEAEVYQNTTKNLLDQVDVSRTAGFTRIWQNVGSLRNSGVEITLNTQNIQKENFEWKTSFNLAHNKNKVLELYNGNDKTNTTTIRREGEDVNSWYLIRWAGVDPRDGHALWYDANGNITRTFSENNRVLVGSTTPDFFGGMTNTIRYKNFQLNSVLIYNVGGYAFSSLQRDSESDGRNLAAYNQSRNQLDRWREPGDLALAPVTVLNANADFGRNSTRFLHKKTSLRIQNISLAYNLPKSWVEQVRLNNASVYFQADNIAFFTPYSTPEDRNDYKNSFTPLPQPLTLSFGLNVGF